MDVLRWIERLLFHCVPAGRFFGVAVRIHWSFWLLPLIMGATWLPNGWINAAIMVAIVLIFYVCVVLHEYGHILMARVFNVRTRDIIITPLGGVARMERMPSNPFEEILIALAGPSVNVIIAFVLGVILYSANRGISNSLVLHSRFASWADVAGLLFLGNVGMAVFNLLPVFPSDGGRVLRAFLATFLHRLPATQLAVGVGMVAAVGMAVVGLMFGAFQLPLIALLFAFIGQMELRMVRQQEQLRGRRVAESRPLTPARAGELIPPEPDFSGYAWDDDYRAWVEWRDGAAVRVCRVRRL